MTEEEIKALQDKDDSLEKENKRLNEENASLKSKNQEQSDSIKGIKDDIAKFKEEVKEEFVKTRESQAHDIKPESLMEAIINAKKE